MHPRLLEDFSVNPPSLIHTGLVTYDDLSENPGLPLRPAPEGTIVETVQNALAEEAAIGKFLTGDNPGSSASAARHCPSVIDINYDKLLVLGGACLRVKNAFLEYAFGEVKPGGKLIGKLVLPFEKSDA